MSEMLTFKTYPIEGSDPEINRINFLHALGSLPGPMQVAYREVVTHDVSPEEMRELGFEHNVLNHMWVKNDERE